MKKILIILITTIGYAYSVNGTITFYDGTSLSGELSSSDTRYVFIIPNGLVMPEKIPVVDIESLNLENGIVLVQDGIAQQTYIDGKFSLIERKTVEQSTASNDEDTYEYESLGNLDYFSLNGFYGVPVYYRPSLLLENNVNPLSLPNLGFGFSSPYFPVGPLNISFGGRILTLGFNTDFAEADQDPLKIKSITFAGLINTDFQPILNFLGDNIHLGVETGITYSLGWKENYDGGWGVLVGGNLDYWLEELPLALRFFGNGYMIPGSGEVSFTGFGNIGASIILVLKRGN